MLFVQCLFLLAAARDYNTNHYFAIRTSKEHIPELTSHFGYQFHGQVGELTDHFLVSLPKTTDSHHVLTKRFESHPKIEWVELQLPSERLFKRSRYESIQEVEKQFDIKDPGFQNQWHLYNTRVPGDDLNVTGVWDQGISPITQGITGTGVTVAFIDDGLDHENPDLKDNFDELGSYDFNFHKKLPTPSLFDDFHGTRCAGEVAAVKNDVCGVGVAYTSKVAGIRVLSGSLTNVDEAAAVNYGYQTTQIYSCSWGPRDDGMTMEAPPEIVTRAVENGIKNGRGGLGSLFVFAAGNGGASEDNCIFTMTIAAMDIQQNHPYYSEECPAIIASMYSSSGPGEGIVFLGLTQYTTDFKNGCTFAHGGTSAAAPLASGVWALVLSVRPDLTWRDAQRLSIENSVVVKRDDTDWKLNGAKRLYNHKYGYGTYDAYKIVESAKTYELVNPQTTVQISSVIPEGRIPDSADGFQHRVLVTKEMVESAKLKRLEHVTVSVTITHQRRGDVAIRIRSPSFESRLIETRRKDASEDGFGNWTMMSVAHWYFWFLYRDEDPVGEWTLVVLDNVNPDKTGVVEGWTLTLYGESTEGVVGGDKDGDGSSDGGAGDTSGDVVSTTFIGDDGSEVVTFAPEPTNTNTPQFIISPVPEIPSNATGIIVSFFIVMGLVCGLLYLAKTHHTRQTTSTEYKFQHLEELEDADFDSLVIDEATVEDRVHEGNVLFKSSDYQ